MSQAFNNTQEYIAALKKKVVLAAGFVAGSQKTVGVTKAMELSETSFRYMPIA
jgi:hypothetical protein